jgi:hypothetical protein
MPRVGLAMRVCLEVHDKYIAIGSMMSLRAMSGLKGLVRRSLGSGKTNVEDDYDYEVDLSRLMPREQPTPPPVAPQRHPSHPPLRERLTDLDTG